MINNPQALPVPQFVDIYVAIAQLVADNDTAIANKSILITSHLPFEAYPTVLEEMKICLQYNTSSKCNAFEVCRICIFNQLLDKLLFLVVCMTSINLILALAILMKIFIRSLHLYSNA